MEFLDNLFFGIESTNSWGLIIIGILILIGGSIRIKDCLDKKRNFFISTIISLGILTINWVFVLSLFLGAGHLGIYIKSLHYIPYYLQYAYFIFCAVGGLWLFSLFYIFNYKFYANYRDKGKFSFKNKSKPWSI